MQKKKKIPISIKSKPLTSQTNKQNTQNTPYVLNQPKSFQQLYQYALKNKQNTKIIYDSKNTTPSNSRIKYQGKQSQTNGNSSFRISYPYQQFTTVLQKLNHQEHSHIRGNQCFLKENQILQVMKQLSYPKYQQLQSYYEDLFQHLEVETYGGVPSENLKIMLQIIEGKFIKSSNTKRYNFPSTIVDNNLKIVITEEEVHALHQYYSSLKNARDKKIQDEENFKKICKKVQALHKDDKKYEIYENSTERKPLLSVDVNLGSGIIEKIIVYEGQTAKQVSSRLMEKFTLNEQTRLKFEKMLENQLSKMLWKIDEVNEELISQRQQQ